MFMHSRHAVEQQLFELLLLQYAIDNDVASQICGNCCDKRTQPTKSNFRNQQKVPLGIATSQCIHRPTTRKRDSGWQLATSRGPRPTPRPLRRGAPQNPEHPCREHHSELPTQVSPLEGSGRDVQKGEDSSSSCISQFSLRSSFLNRFHGRSRSAYYCVPRPTMIGRIVTDAIPDRVAKQNPGREENKKYWLRL